MAKQKKKKKTSGKKVYDITLTLGFNRLITAKWKFNTTKYQGVDHYELVFKYWVDSAKDWFDASAQSKHMTYQYTAPNNASRVKLKVKPVPKDSNKKKKNTKKKIYRWQGDWAGPMPPQGISVDNKELAPADPHDPKLRIEGNMLTAFIENYTDPNGTANTQIEFEIVKDGKELVSLAPADLVSSVNLSMASIRIPVAYGSEYSARCRAVRNGYYSEWTSYTSLDEGIATPPDTVKDIVSLTTLPDKKGVRIEWTPATGAKKYEIQYIQDKTQFGISSKTSSVTTEEGEGTVYILTDGFYDDSKDKEWFFRVRGVNDGGGTGGNGNGPWSPIKSIIVGEKPDVPTTWTFNTSVGIGDPIIFNWTHNTVDGSEQRQAEILLEINGEETTIPISGNKIKKHTFPTDGYSDSTEILWKVRTLGAVDEWSDYSVQRTVHIYAKPSVSLNMIQGGDTFDVDTTQPEYASTNQFERFPFKTRIVASPITQNILSYVFTIAPEESYETADPNGTTVYISKGSPILTKYVDNPGTNTIEFDVTPGDATFETGIRYKAMVTVAMSSGLTASASFAFSTLFESDLYDPDAQVIVKLDTLSAAIRPYCLDEWGDLVTSGALLSVYRRNYDGTLTLLQDKLPIGRNHSIPDPHPSLDYARYRIVAQSIETGEISYYDTPGYPILENSIVIQWDEAWSDYNYNDEDEQSEPAFAGSMVRLPYNVDVSDSSNPDISLISYIGRENPVSYYGTQKGYTASWRCDIPKEDAETIYALRRLQRYAGDVYVREPSGTGYWANIKVQLSISHNSPVVPASFNVTRVEGGI